MTWRGRGVEVVSVAEASGRLASVVSVTVICASVFFASACTDGVQQVEPVDCDPVADTGCGAGTHCRLLAAGERACLATGSATETGCSPGNCAAGEACAVVEGRLACRAVCEVGAEASCGSGTCGYAIADGPWGVCLRPCTLGACDAGSSCAPIAAARHPICVATGDAQAGDPCRQARCAAALGCLLREDEPRCTPLCRPATNDDCVSGQCVGIIRDSEGLQYCDG